MEIKITKGKADFNTSPLGNSKEVVFVEFPNCISTTTNKSFKWMPTYRQLEEIRQALKEIEEISWKDNNNHSEQLKISEEAK